MGCGQVRGLFWRKLFTGFGDLGAQRQCRLFRLVQALIFGDAAGSLGPFSGGFVLCVVVSVGLCLAILVPITTGIGTLVGRSAVMDLLPGGENRPPKCSRKGCCFFFGTLLGRYCGGSFASRIPTWRLPDGHAADLVAEGSEEASIVLVEPGAPADMPCFNGGGGVNWMSGPGGGVKKSPTKKLGFSLGHVFGRD